MTMDKRVLVAYATRYGSTQGVAEAIGEELRRAGAQVDLKAASDVTGVAGYQAVIVGSPVYAGKWLPQATHLIKANEDSLAQRPVAYFTVGLLIRQKPEEGRKEHEGVIQQLRQAAPGVVPVTVGMFDGAYDPRKVNLIVRLMMRMMRAEKGDFRDWEAIRSWARSLEGKWREAA